MGRKKDRKKKGDTRRLRRCRRQPSSRMSSVRCGAALPRGPFRSLSIQDGDHAGKASRRARAIIDARQHSHLFFPLLSALLEFAGLDTLARPSKHNGHRKTKCQLRRSGNAPLNRGVSRRSAPSRRRPDLRVAIARARKCIREAF